MQGKWPRAVIFDLDGTLVDTAPDLAASLNQALAEHDLPPHPLPSVRLMIGGGLAKLAERALTAHDTDLDDTAREAFAKRLYAIYAARPAETSRLYPGAAETLGALQGQGIELGLCTNKPHEISVAILERLGIASHFACVLGSDNGFPKKPDPAMVLHVLARLGTDASDTVFVGDSVTDVRTARAAFLARIVLVSYGYSARPAHTLGADAVTGSLADLPRLLTGLTSKAGVTRT
jgi:phosphoglycolate phosphatase